MKYLFLLFLFCFSFFSTAETVEKTLASVEGEMISLMDLKEAKKRLKRGFFDDSLLLTLFKKKQLQRKESLLLEFLIYKQLLDIFATKAQLQINEKHVQQEIKHKRKKRGLSKKVFSRRLVRSHFTSSSYKEFLKKSLARKLFIQKEIMEKIRISDEDLNEYAVRKQGKALFTSFEYDLAYLLFPSTKIGKEYAQKIFQSLSKDSTFFDKWNPSKKGEKREILKKITLSSLHPSIKKTIQKLSTGQTSPILSLPSGYHIFKVLWKTPIITTKNQKRKTALSNLLFEELFNQKLKDWLEAQKVKSFIQTSL